METGEHYGTEPGAPEVSVVFPCLNEEKTLAECVRRARAALDGAGLAGEIVVADNGSTDRSAAIAEECGARVVPVRGRGYGCALRAGLAAARAPFLVFMDADLSYDPAYVPEVAAALRGGADMVMGSRMRGKIDPGAMPTHHRYFGTPALTIMARLLFRAKITDINCGLRGITREALDRMSLCTEGMEFASEMIIQATHHKLRIAEVPIHFHRDQRGREPHLRSFRDGWRHLQLMLHYAPLWLFFGPGMVSILTGLALVWLAADRLPPATYAAAALAGVLMAQVGVQTLLLGLTSQDRIAHPRWHEHGFLGRFSEVVRRLIMLENGLLLSTAVLLAGLAGLGWSLLRLDAAEPASVTASLRAAFLSGTLAMTGIQVFSTCVFLGLFGRNATPPDVPSRDSAKEKDRDKR